SRTTRTQMFRCPANIWRKGDPLVGRSADYKELNQLLLTRKAKWLSFICGEGEARKAKIIV
ncbi:MAG TPA: hypothetical protein VFD55_00415, partial [Candidatus Angelobacter sp.]|nr:hypothetical protein [Candidatus Angelobacter sp.]